jgi:glutathione S-transferase
MKLFHMPRTRSSRVLWTAKEIGADVDIEPVDLTKGEGQSPEHKARHPHGKLPAAQIGDESFIESGAIALHLALHEGAEPPFLPDLKSLQGAKLLQWAFYATATLDDLTIDAYLQQRFAPDDKRDDALIQRAEKAWKDVIAPYLTKELGDKPYLMGDDFSLADIMVGYPTFFADQLGWIDGELKAWVARLAERPAFREAFAM